MGMYEKFTPVIVRNELTTVEETMVEELVALANSGSGQYLTKSGGSIVNTTAAWTVSNGGTGVTSLTAYALLAGGTTSTGAIQQVVDIGAAGQILISNGPGILPSFQNDPSVGTVTSVSVVTANGVSGSVATPT